MTSDSIPPGVSRWTATLLQGAILVGMAGGVSLAFDIRERMARVETRLDNIERHVERGRIK